jgi:nanoRNase/pAp phosphatase (c-di-AMP/oligoRNAs hydrolase)
MISSLSILMDLWKELWGISINYKETEGVTEKSKFSRILEKHRGEKHIIVLPVYPQPDAVASAFAHTLISKEYDIEVAIFYSGQIRHRQNVALIKLLGIDIHQYDENTDLERYDRAVLIFDHGVSNEEILQALQKANKPVLLAFDQPENGDSEPASFSEIQRTIATSTVYTEFIEQGILQFDKSRKEHVAISTALLYGILSATDNFVRAAPEDFAAAAFLSQFRDAELLEHIMSQARSKQVLEIIRRALGDKVIVESYSIAGIGYLRNEDRDAISQAAEFLLTEENVHTAIVYGIMYGDDKSERLVGSMRTSKITIYPEEFIQDLFGKIATTGRDSDASVSSDGFNITIDFLAGDHSKKYQELKWLIYDAQVKYKIFERIGVKQEVLKEE